MKTWAFSPFVCESQSRLTRHVKPFPGDTTTQTHIRTALPCVRISSRSVNMWYDVYPERSYRQSCAFFMAYLVCVCELLLFFLNPVNCCFLELTIHLFLNRKNGT